MYSDLDAASFNGHTAVVSQMQENTYDLNKLFFVKGAFLGPLSMTSVARICSW